MITYKQLEFDFGKLRGPKGYFMTSKEELRISTDIDEYVKTSGIAYVPYEALVGIVLGSDKDKPPAHKMHLLDRIQDEALKIRTWYIPIERLKELVAGLR